MKTSILQALNQQIQHEQNNAHIYQGVALYFKGMNLNGLAAWMEKQVADERDHARRLIDHVVDRGGAVQLGALPAPRTSYENPLDAVKMVLALEKSTTGKINNLYELAKKEKDHPLEIALHWFISEQVEEEQWASELAGLMEQFHKNPGQLYMLDHRWGGRLKRD
jgi:ferritin